MRRFWSGFIPMAVFAGFALFSFPPCAMAVPVVEMTMTADADNCWALDDMSQQFSDEDVIFWQQDLGQKSDESGTIITAAADKPHSQFGLTAEQTIIVTNEAETAYVIEFGADEGNVIGPFLAGIVAPTPSTPEVTARSAPMLAEGNVFIMGFDDAKATSGVVTARTAVNFGVTIVDFDAARKGTIWGG